MKRFTNEVLIGIFVVAAIGVGVFFWMRTQNLEPDTYSLKTYFNFAGGIKENSVVALSGIEVGRVEKINFTYEPDTKVEVILAISNKAKVRTDSLCYIGTAGFIGDAFIGITPGSKDMGFVDPGATLASEDPIEFRILMKKADAIATGLSEAMAEVKNLGKSFAEPMADIGKLAKNLNSTVSDNRTKIDNIFKNLETTSVNFNDFSADIKAHPWKLLMKGKE